MKVMELRRRNAWNVREFVCTLTEELDRCTTGKWCFASYLLNIDHLGQGTFAIRVPGRTVGSLKTENGIVSKCIIDDDCIGEDKYFTDKVLLLCKQIVGVSIV